MSEEMKTSPTPKSTKLVKEMSFDKAIAEVIKGKKVTRVEWANNKIYMYRGGGDLRLEREDGPHVFHVREVDMDAVDWVVVDE